jgi:hypothetical protein
MIAHVFDANCNAKTQQTQGLSRVYMGVAAVIER